MLQDRRTGHDPWVQDQSEYLTRSLYLHGLGGALYPAEPEMTQALMNLIKSASKVYYNEIHASLPVEVTEQVRLVTRVMYTEHSSKLLLSSLKKDRSLSTAGSGQPIPNVLSQSFHTLWSVG